MPCGNSSLSLSSAQLFSLLGTGFLFKSLSCLIELPKYLLKNWPYELSLVNLTAFLLLTGSVCSVALL